jgi:phospholipid/cholesterol/gamma-HCH transport system ATP-binding protein
MDPIILKLENVRKSFGKKRVLRGIDLELRKNELISIFGASGSGKSVLLKIVIGLLHADEGRIWFEGKDISYLEEQEYYPIRTKIAYVFQDGALFDSLTVEGNLAYPIRIHTDWTEERIHRTVDERLERLDLKGTNNLYPSQLSGGMQKRVGLARATILSPKVILFDEPTAGLDPINVRRFARTVLRLKRSHGMTGFFVTHDIACARAISDRICILRDGLVYALDAVEAICRSTDPIIRSFTDMDYSNEFDLGSSDDAGQTTA